MRVISVNIGCRQQIDTASGPVETGILKKPTAAAVVCDRLGIEGDAIVDTSAHGGEDQAVYLYSQEDYDWWAERLKRSLSPGLFGENLTISGADVGAWKIGDRLQINDVILEISAPRTPCFKLAAVMGGASFIRDFIEAERTGAYARVLQPGTINCGAAVLYYETAMDFPSITAVFRQYHTKSHDLAIIKKALASPLAVSPRKTLQKLERKYAGH